MTTTERLKRIGSQELRKRLGPNLVRGLIASVFIHSAIVSIGLFEWSDEPEKGGRGGRIVQIPPPQSPPEKDRYTQPIRRFEKPVLPEVEIPIPVEEEPKLVEEPDPEIPEMDKLIERYGTSSDPAVQEQNGWGNGEDPLVDLDVNSAGFEKPWEKYVAREIEPVPLSTNPRPEFPSIAAKAGITAKVRVWVLVGVDGSVEKWIIIDTSTPGLGFEEAVEAVIGKWQFTPAIQGRQPVAVWVNIPFSFRIKN
ncbi:TonB family protein [bacterium]|nr:TonB family protein [bacterium]MBU1637491.1 TonB family protein [bacterium]